MVSLPPHARPAARSLRPEMRGGGRRLIRFDVAHITRLPSVTPRPRAQPRGGRRAAAPRRGLPGKPLKGQGVISAEFLCPRGFSH